MIGRAVRQGFSLIEALVALAILAVVLTAVFELQSQMARGQQRAERSLAEVVSQENAIALLKDLNPMERPDGTISLPDGDTISWTSTPRSAARTNAGFPAGDGLYTVQLYTVDVSVVREDGVPVRPLSFQRVGYLRGALPSAED